MHPAPLLTSEVARLCHVSAETVREWERAGRLKARKTAGGVRLFDPREVARLVRARAAQQAPSAPIDVGSGSAA
jgi:excisionase family DNA binding protein